MVSKCVFCVFWDELETLCILCILDELCSLDGKCVFCVFWDESETLCILCILRLCIVFLPM